ncbi:helix-turn-helix domain-containing protein [uncultured Tateyamaria sp.]|uniref:helix-turn-helix domain-containing protein n=1 Tax=uncultured Tateyamaria sp. TaxID=455651 RepID=UPI002635A48A|nr:helix-turn-helix domain-containing protein [uncultured Tateyamaria sp.]
MKQIGQSIRERNIIIKGGDALSLRGFTQVPNAVLKSEEISSGAKLVYALLLSYAWHNDFCFPGQETLARDIGIARGTVNRHVQELAEKGFIKITRKGQGRANVYELNLKARVLGKRR